MSVVVQAGAVVFEHCEILKYNGEGIDIINQSEGIIIYEDMFSPFITGELIVRDTLDLPNVLGRSGKDVVKLKIYTPGAPKEQHIDNAFIIYKIGDKEIVADRTQTYKIYFASYEFGVDFTSHLSRKFSGSGDKITETIVKEHLKSTKSIIADKPSNSTTFVSNFWTPSKCTGFVADHSLSSKGSPSFLFYENRDGFNFRDIHSIAESKYMQQFNASDFNTMNIDEGANKAKAVQDPLMQYTNIAGIRLDTTYDFLRDYIDGTVSSKMYTFDPVTKKTRISLYDLNNIDPILNSNKLYQPNVVGSTAPVIMYKARGYGTFGLAEYTNYAYLQKRVGLLNLLQASKLEIDVFPNFCNKESIPTTFIALSCCSIASILVCLIVNNF